MTMAFDTLKFGHRLEQVGVPRDQAETHAELARDMIVANLETKDDLAAAVKNLRAFNQTGVDLSASITMLGESLLADVKQFERRNNVSIWSDRDSSKVAVNRRNDVLMASFICE
jgi:hypothetical protein